MTEPTDNQDWEQAETLKRITAARLRVLFVQDELDDAEHEATSLGCTEAAIKEANTKAYDQWFDPPDTHDHQLQDTQ